MNSFKGCEMRVLKTIFLGVVFLFVWPAGASTPLFKAESKPSLMQQKTAELEGKWKVCVQLAKRNFQQNPTLQPWVLKSWMTCARRSLLNQGDPAAVEELLKTVQLHENLFFDSSGAVSLQKELNQFLRTQKKSGPYLVLEKQSEKTWDWVLSRSFVEASVKAQVWLLWSESLQKKSNLVGALEFIERSLAQVESLAAKERRRSLELLLRKDRLTEAIPIIETGVEAEDNFEVRFRESEQKQDWVNLMQDLVDYLKSYPSGKKASWADEKIRSLLVRFGPKATVDQAFIRLREKLINKAKNADPVRLAEWARVFHRRADYLVSLNLSSEALGFFEKTEVASELLWICGRSAQFLGSYRQSRTCFEILIESHRGSSYFHEALFRLGLVHYRQKQWSSARAQFETLLAEGLDRFDLNSRYWLVRIGQKLNSVELVEKHREVILAKYPLSYYGLRLRLEKTSDSRLVGVIPELSAKKSEAEFTWTGREHVQLSKVALLAKNGWYNEALKEFEALTWPRSLENKIVMIPQLARLGLYFPVVRLTNEVTDIDPEHRSVDLLQWSYPQAFLQTIRAEAEARKISPFLVRSVIRQESAFRADIASSSDARGLMQMIPPTGEEVAADLEARDVLIPEDLSRPLVNIQFGTYYLAKMLNRFSRHVPAALAAYNAGPTRVELFFQARSELLMALSDPSSAVDQEIWFDELPWSETSFYIKAILRNSFLFQWLEANPPSGEVRELKLPALLWSNLLLPAES